MLDESIMRGQNSKEQTVGSVHPAASKQLLQFFICILVFILPTAFFLAIGTDETSKCPTVLKLAEYYFSFL